MRFSAVASTVVRSPSGVTKVILDMGVLTRLMNRVSNGEEFRLLKITYATPRFLAVDA
ncbi:MAG: hypothetical protein SynsKO_06010 [Synoicihabitans sp.]